METISNYVVSFLNYYVSNVNIVSSFFLGIFIIILESILPMLPLGLFVAFNVLIFGNVLGFFMSWGATLIGCSLSFFIFRKIRKKIDNYIERKPKFKSVMENINKISFSNLVIIMAFPFTPAFSINIGAGLSNIPYKKFIMAASIAKVSIVYFWGYIGSTFIESMTDPGVLIKLGIIFLIAFLLSKFVTKKFKID